MCLMHNVHCTYQKASNKCKILVIWTFIVHVSLFKRAHSTYIEIEERLKSQNVHIEQLNWIQAKRFFFLDKYLQ